MLDEIDEKIDKNAVVPIAHLTELQEKAKLLADRAKQLQAEQAVNLENYIPEKQKEEPKYYSWEEVKARITSRWKDIDDSSSKDT